jgi:glucosamine--fructose-6-phosphate aminotransferase (isomerizing)
MRQAKIHRSASRGAGVEAPALHAEPGAGMCGIFGAISTKPVVDTLVEGLRRLEYRGYDSAGVATLGEDGLSRVCVVGKVAGLTERLAGEKRDARIGIGHTRWATHGAPSLANAHPHMAPGVAVVHNGIVDNHRDLRKSLASQGCRFQSETDTEVVPWLIARDLASGRDVGTAMRNLSGTIHGSYALAVLTERDPRKIHAKRLGSPLVAAIGPEGGFVASDVTALAGYAGEAVVLEDHDTVALDDTSMTITDRAGRLANRQTVKISATVTALDRGDHRHFMHKEIFEQAAVAHRINAAYADEAQSCLEGIDFQKLTRIRMVACGTSFFACMVARRWFAEIAGLPADIEIASEFGHMPLLRNRGELAILVSQSGETADTLAALCRLREAGIPTLGVVNQEVSTLAREASFCAPLLAGPEIGVASTKAFMAQLLVLAHIAALAGSLRMGPDRVARFRHGLRLVPDLIEEALRCEPAIATLAERFRPVGNAIFVGRGLLYPLALEGALKLKETSYIHAEGFAAGELKHGPIALIDQQTHVVALAPTGETFAKVASNTREIAARGGKIVVIGDMPGVLALDDVAHAALLLPGCDDLIQPMLAAVPLQLLAYHVAVLRGCDVDRPRNLAKSVTVE